MFIADLHIHSLYSRATSKSATLEEYYKWAKIKGIDVISTGDFLHPRWLEIIKEKLLPQDNGLLELKEKPQFEISSNVEPQFCLSTEISLIYKKNGKTRKVHHLVFVPTIEVAEKLANKLSLIGNISSDGRPILGITSKELLSIVKDISSWAFLIPAHIWTPWFSLFGANSGYDDIEECFEDMTSEIFALETGLSSDPPMNWRCSSLDRFLLISNSDAHSPQKLGREACVFNTDSNYYKMFEALKTKNGNFWGTVEFFPEEGKYHFDGHRKCGIVVDPTQEDTKVCPVCGKPLTIGVMHRVIELADRDKPIKPESGGEFIYLVPLPEILAQIYNTSVNGKKVNARFNELIRKYGSEFYILRELPIDILQKEDPYLACAISNVREKRVKTSAGFDGEYGKITVLTEEDLKNIGGQKFLFEITTPKEKRKKKNKSPNRVKKVLQDSYAEIPAQKEIITSSEKNILVHAGPGSGKTYVLIKRLEYLLKQGVSPSECLILTFTNRATEEIEERIKRHKLPLNIPIYTFHSFCYRVLTNIYPEVNKIYTEKEREIILKELFPSYSPNRVLKKIMEDYQEDPSWRIKYKQFLRENNACDMMFLIQDVIELDKEKKIEYLKKTYKYIFVDEFQDINEEQYNLLSIFYPKSSFFIIGDPDQAIYAWRGSKPELFYKFGAYIDAKIYKLTINFRSSSTIIDTANTLISHNTNPHLQVKSYKKNQGKNENIELLLPENIYQEADMIVERIEKLIGGLYFHSSDTSDISPSDIAILSRVREVQKYLIEKLKTHGIPIEITTDHILENKKIQTLLNILKYIITKDKYYLLSIYQEIKENAQSKAKEKELKNIEDNLLALKGKSLEEILLSLHQLFPLFFDFKDSLFQQFKEFADRFGKDIERLVETFDVDPFFILGNLKPQGVVISTFHAVKGMEFKVVFITDLVEGIVPSIYNSDIQEERRLFYVAITRAKQKLILSAPSRVSLKDPRIGKRHSRFIDEIDEFLIKITSTSRSTQLKLF